MIDNKLNFFFKRQIWHIGGLILLFYAGYQIGVNGYEDFMSNINLRNIGENISNLFARLDTFIDNFKS